MLRKREEGFTLIELMIVIAIIGVLAAIAIPNFISYRNKSYCTKITADAQSLKAAIGAYFSNPANSTVSKAAYDAGKIKDVKLTASTVKALSTTADVIRIDLAPSEDGEKCKLGTQFTAYMNTKTDGGWDIP